jgi:hypothetical protein
MSYKYIGEGTDMAKVNWSWRPGKQAPRAKIDGVARVQGSPRSTVPHVEQKTEKAMTGGWGQGTGANVSNTMRGVNTAHDTAMTAIGTLAKAHTPGRMKERQRTAERRKAANMLAPQKAVGPMQTPKVRAPMPHIEPGTLNVALASWQEHALSRLKTKR